MPAIAHDYINAQFRNLARFSDALIALGKPLEEQISQLDTCVQQLDSAWHGQAAAGFQAYWATAKSYAQSIDAVLKNVNGIVLGLLNDLSVIERYLESAADQARAAGLAISPTGDIDPFGGYGPFGPMLPVQTPDAKALTEYANALAEYRGQAAGTKSQAQAALMRELSAFDPDAAAAVTSLLSAQADGGFDPLGSLINLGGGVLGVLSSGPVSAAGGYLTTLVEGGLSEAEKIIDETRLIDPDLSSLPKAFSDLSELVDKYPWLRFGTKADLALFGLGLGLDLYGDLTTGKDKDNPVKVILRDTTRDGLQAVTGAIGIDAGVALIGTGVGAPAGVAVIGCTLLAQWFQGNAVNEWFEEDWGNDFAHWQDGGPIKGLLGVGMRTWGDMGTDVGNVAQGAGDVWSHTGGALIDSASKLVPSLPSLPSLPPIGPLPIPKVDLNIGISISFP